ncbi:5-formyltetrahydrofolate cyclo-ligase [Antribacter gilvus]|uniref:5-formyltetrahydrofolate cyclo-ligase n=1 Tax=Antribacter gilvus TaxID=2304675 RepID=UPI001F0C70A1|nr:5-formyltetrahydrofolate cyclo-ligase [Antribacter gilvus]
MSLTPSPTTQPYPVKPGMETEDAKEQLRRAIRAHRTSRSARLRAEAAVAFADVIASVPEVREATCVAAYAARATEPNTGPLLELLAARGARVLLPVLGTGLARDWAEYDGPEDLLERAPGRPPEPSSPALGADAVSAASVIIAPALAVDSRGVRLGQGGGWYDRVLAHAHPEARVLAVVFPEEFYDATVRPLPVMEHDVLVHGVATTTDWRWLD